MKEEGGGLAASVKTGGIEFHHGVGSGFVSWLTALNFRY